jgi:hypothetical protein
MLCDESWDVSEPLKYESQSMLLLVGSQRFTNHRVLLLMKTAKTDELSIRLHLTTEIKG